MMKKLFVISLLALLYTDAQALNLNHKPTQVKFSQLCDDCDSCGEECADCENPDCNCKLKPKTK
ncbi:MAG: hypothetical protein JO129_03410 [Candidatus Dependentiae bacterium]|nr:hypothetical protein [Candidatus Dependentiae bacterium]